MDDALRSGTVTLGSP